MRLLTRNDRDVTGTFPEVADALTAQEADDFVVDGEVVAFRDGQTSFSLLQQRLGVAHPAAELIEDFPVFYYIFDVLFAAGQDTRGLPQRERKERLHALLDFTGPLRYTEHRTGDGEAFYRQACVDGWEGLIAKRADAPYAEGRTRNWLKFKCIAGQELVIGGWTDPQGSRQGLGALLVGYYDADGQLTYAGKVGTGFSHRDPAQPARVAVRAGTRHLAVRQRQAAAGGRALGRAAHGRPDRVRRVDHRRPAPPAPVRGPARRQGRRRSRPRDPGPIGQQGQNPYFERTRASLLVPSKAHSSRGTGQ